MASDFNKKTISPSLDKFADSISAFNENSKEQIVALLESKVKHLDQHTVAIEPLSSEEMNSLKDQVYASTNNISNLTRRDFLKLGSVWGFLSSGVLLTSVEAKAFFNLLLIKKASASSTYVDDVFSTYLYTGNGGTNTITNGIDLSGKGGLVWNKARSGTSGTDYHFLHDSVRGVSKYLISNLNNSEATASGNGVTAFNTNGFSVASGQAPSFGNLVNQSGTEYVTWTFRKAAKFFDIVTWSGDGANNRVLSHSLGLSPGMIIVKRTTGGTENWPVWHRSVSAGGAGNLFLNLTIGLSGAKISDASSTTFTLGISDTSHNSVGSTYVAYLFAHDTSANGIIQCGSFTTDGSGNASVALGWEPQYLLWKRIDDGTSWWIQDIMRGWINSTSGYDKVLQADSSDAETAGTYEWGEPTANGYNVRNQGASKTFIYLAIRRPNKPPTSGTQVYNAITRTGTNAATSVTGIGFSPDFVFSSDKNLYMSNVIIDRLRGPGRNLITNATSSEQYNVDDLTEFTMDGYKVGANNNTYAWNKNQYYINYFFKRAPGVFDIVCYTGDGTTNRSLNHALGTIPELIFIKQRNGSGNWLGVTQRDTSRYFTLNSSSAFINDNTAWPQTNFSATVFQPDPANNIGQNVNAQQFVAYLFASKSGISKVGNYTGNGTNQTINCAFITGARFILIKRTDSTSDWFVWDTARGITASANDPHLSLNTAIVEVTTDDSIDPDNSGFIVKQNATTNINVNTATYIFLAIA